MRHMKHVMQTVCSRCGFAALPSHNQEDCLTNISTLLENANAIIAELNAAKYTFQSCIGLAKTTLKLARYDFEEGKGECPEIEDALEEIERAQAEVDRMTGHGVKSKMGHKNDD